MAAITELIVDAECLLNVFQVFNVKARSERLAATDTRGLLRPGAFFFVELHSDLRRTLEDMEELSKRQIQQSEDYGDCMQD